jgi:cyclic beta-1,2-glucan synthetase
MAGLATGRSEETGLAFNWTFMDLIRRRIFGAPRGRDGELRAEQPLRSELLSVDQLRQHARTIASSHEIDKRFGPDQLLPRLAENEVALLGAYEAVSDAVKQGVRIAPAADWLLDNFHLIEEQIRTARRHLPRTYSGELPRLASGPLAGYPRVYAIALELISHGDGRVDAESLSGFVASYQAITTLKLGELWAIPTMLRLALLENLRRIAIRIAMCRWERETANLWADRMLEVAEKEPKELVLALADLVREDPPLTSAFVAEFTRRLRGQNPGLTLPMGWLEHHLAETNHTVEQLIQLESQDQAADQVSMSNSIGSLRFLSAMDWREFVETLSAVERVLRSDPADVYNNMDFATRDRYRHMVEELAKRSPILEEEIARRAIQLARDRTAPAAGDDRAAHVGYYLIDKGRTLLEHAIGVRRSVPVILKQIAGCCPLVFYGGAILTLTALLTTAVLLTAARYGLGAWGFLCLGIPLLLCASHLSVSVVSWVATRLVAPRTLPRMEFSQGIPPEARTLVVVPTMLTSAAGVRRLLESLELCFLANHDTHLHFGLLTDLRDASQETLPSDAELVRLASDGIEALNAQYATERDDAFFLFHRPRRWNEQEGVWMGWERKRGKLAEFNALLRGGAKDRFCAIVGQSGILPSIRFVITLDTDTQLPRDAARQLVGTMAHPLNRPRFDPKLGRVVEGYGILQPRVGVSLPSAGRSRFARLFTAEPGIDPYTRAVSDVYQDLFGEGSYIGKGIYDVDAFEQAVGARFPENRILSHDLLEGSHARAGLVSDVVLLEEHPSRYTDDAGRRHRWIRGDWQITPWMLPRVPGPDARRVANPISGLARWKIFDNLRRSLAPVGLVALLLLGWALPGPPLLYSLIVIGIISSPAILTGIVDLLRKAPDLPTALHLEGVARSAGRRLAQAAVGLVCLPYDAFISLDAIARALVRVLFTRRKLLEWQTAHDAEQHAHAGLSAFCRSMWIGPITALVAAALLAVERPAILYTAGPILGLWLLSPIVAWWLSRPIKSRRPQLRTEDQVFLQQVARRTWRFFETFVGPADHHLPPDNYQEHPTAAVAHRTSPTNIGLSLLTNLAAYDFGYVSARELIERTSKTLTTMGELERHRGHFYNWYDTRTLEPLAPRYVSAVDSGNLAGLLLTLGPGLLELADGMIIPPRSFVGLMDTLGVFLDVARGQSPPQDGLSPATPSSEIVPRLERLQNELRIPPLTLTAARLLLESSATAGTELAAAVSPASDDELKYWAQAFERQCRDFLEDLLHLAPWCQLPPPSEQMWQRGSVEQVQRLSDLRQVLRRLDDVPTLRDVAQLSPMLLRSIDEILANLREQGPSTPAAENAWFTQLRHSIVEAGRRAGERLAELETLALRCQEMADFNYDFLYDKSRLLLSIGYNVDHHRLDPGFYDLLASEARLGSFVAIAQGKLPQEHWFSLGRLLTAAGGEYPLLSWSGSMFEYLMPLLIMPTFEQTLLDRSCRAVVERQIEYGRRRGIPWGISESGYNATDVNLIYQYRTFGVPGLGLKRGLADDLVVAPYASTLALMIAPERACANLHRLARDGLLGAHGFYEAVDFTPARVPRGQRSVVIRSFMAHHQGMSFLSLAYLLLDRPMQRRFQSDPLLRATESLLQERVPKAAPFYPHDGEAAESRPRPGGAEATLRVATNPQTAAPEVHLLSNGRYHVMVSAAGGGYSRWKDLAVTRWQEDPTRDCWGAFCYLRDVERGEFWSAAHQPTLKQSAAYEAVFSQAQAEFRRRDEDVETHTEITVSPEDDIELRRISITNRGVKKRIIELTSYAEPVLADAASDATHPAFSKLFVQTEILPQRQAVLCTRRPCSSAEHPPWMFHLAVVHGAALGEASYETDRCEFVGRGRSLEDPAAMHVAKLSNRDGSVLDPILAIRRAVTVGPDETIRIDFVTGVADTRDAVMALIEKYQDSRMADRVFNLAWTHSGGILRQLGAAEVDAQLYGRLAGAVLYADPRRRALGSLISRNRRGQSGLWGYGISGDLPIVLLRISDQANIELVRQLAQAHAYWRAKGLTVDLVILNEDQSGYRQVLQDQITGLIAAGTEAHPVDRPGGIFVRRSEQISDDDKVLVEAVARVIITDTAGTLMEQVERRDRAATAAAKFIPTRARRSEVPQNPGTSEPDLAFFNGLGGFTRDGHEYVITTTAENVTPAPWVNVLANPEFGTVVTESGGAYTWAENAHEFRLTPWYSDPVSDVSGETFYIRDEETGHFWSPAPLPARGAMPYTTRHGFGYTVFEYAENGLSSELWTYVAIDAPVKLCRLKIRNSSGRARRLSVTGFVEWVLGGQRWKNALHIVTELDPQTGAVLARNPYNSEFPEHIAFFSISEPQRTVTADRTEFLGRNGTPADPAAMGRAALSGKVGPALDPCAALQAVIELVDGQEREVIFILGAAHDATTVSTLIGRFCDPAGARQALESVCDYWNRTLGAVYVETPDPAVNFLVNGWLLYQTLACRLHGRSGFYQSGGAVGFRDQLQDVMALVHAEPRLFRAHLLRCAAHQFREGDVQHWWHPPLDRGVRTRISDDYLWLPYAVCRYVSCVGDTGVLDERVHFLEGRPVRPEEESYYDRPVRSEESATLYDHCVRAINNGLKFGAHGLPLMGCGDWNDGMNLVGCQGKGESVWLAFFLYDVLMQFREIARRRDDVAFAETCETQAAKLRQSIEQHAWDGQWYRRAYFDNGEPLGSATSPECQIDLLPQSWSVLSRAGDPARARAALDAVDHRLVRRDLGLVQLLAPPFDRSSLDPGYIKGYVPGVRENGGQYTHAAVWTAMAFAAISDGDRAWELLSLINPISHSQTLDAVQTYKVEPYVVPADVYSNRQHIGRGGWTWYTGGAGWMYRLLTESLLGLRLEVDRLHLEPVLPGAWKSLKIHYRYRETFHHISIRNNGGNTVKRIVFDGLERADRTIPLLDDRQEHNVDVDIG